MKVLGKSLIAALAAGTVWMGTSGLAAAETVLTPARFGSVRRAYIVCDQDRAIGPARQGELADRQGVARRGVLHASHSPFFSVPAELAALIRDMT